MHCSVHAMICTYIRETLISNKTFSERNISSQFEMSGLFQNLYLLTFLENLRKMAETNNSSQCSGNTEYC